jgi:hypothetical protein
MFAFTAVYEIWFLWLTSWRSRCITTHTQINVVAMPHTLMRIQEVLLGSAFQIISHVEV